MKRIKTSSLMLLFTGIAFIAVAFINYTSAAKSNNNKVADVEGKGFALVELFTSEGCSSCPAADELVAKVEKEVGDKPVYILAYHVDYWDRLGWKDTFSNAAYTRRQKQYAGWLNLSQIYTPQIVVNGKTEFVGSQESALRKALNTGLQAGSEVQLSLMASRNAGNTATIRYKLEGGAASSSEVLLLATVQKQAVIKVKSGENGGRTLAHTQIVRNLQSLPLSKSDGTTTVSLPAGFDPGNWELIGFVQNTANGAVSGASKTNFK